MSNYIDSTFAALDGVLLSYNGKKSSLDVPERLADMRIFQIGNGAFMQSENLWYIKIPQSITKIGEAAFYRCNELSEVSLSGKIESVGSLAFCLCPMLCKINLCDVEVSQNYYNNIKASGIKFGKSTYISEHLSDIKCLNDTLTATGISPASRIPDRIEKLFVSQSITDQNGKGSLTRKLGCYDITKGETFDVEDESIKDLILSGKETPVDRVTEQKNDQFSKTDKIPLVPKTAVLLFDDEKTKNEDGRVFISVSIRIGYHFWQSKVPVLYGRKPYYVYRRHYLSSTENLDYIRRDTAIYRGDELVKDKTEARKVYAKYKLLSIL